MQVHESCNSPKGFGSPLKTPNSLQHPSIGQDQRKEPKKIMLNLKQTGSHDSQEIVKTHLQSCNIKQCSPMKSRNLAKKDVIPLQLSSSDASAKKLTPGSRKKLQEKSRAFFLKHKRFSMGPQDQILRCSALTNTNSPKIKGEEEKKEETFADVASRTQSQVNEEKFIEQTPLHQIPKKRKKRYTKYKYQTYRNQLKRVPQAPHLSNNYLIQNNFNAPQLSHGFLPFQEHLELQQQFQQPHYDLLPTGTLGMQFSSTIMDIGASMSFLQNEDLALNLDLLNPSLTQEPLGSGTHPNINFSEIPTVAAAQDQNHNSSTGPLLPPSTGLEGLLEEVRSQLPTQGTHIAQIQPPQVSRREQMLKEIRSQQVMIENLMKQIKEQDDRIKALCNNREPLQLQ